MKNKFVFIFLLLSFLNHPTLAKINYLIDLEKINNFSFETNVIFEKSILNLFPSVKQETLDNLFNYNENFSISVDNFQKFDQLIDKLIKEKEILISDTVRVSNEIISKVNIIIVKQRILSSLARALKININFDQNVLDIVSKHKTKIIIQENVVLEKPSPGAYSYIGAAGGLAAIAGGGLGGGGSSSSGGSCNDGCYRNTINGSFGTEYNANSALAAQNILSFNDYGYTGGGIKVGVVDSGIDFDHQEFSGKQVLGTDFASSASGFDDDENGHGTHVASIIAGVRDGQGMRGMAYDATLYSYKVDNDGDSGLEGITASNLGLIFNQHVTDGAKVSNNSWGSGTDIAGVSENSIRTNYSAWLTSLTNFKNNGGVVVFAAGNEQLSNPDQFGGAPYRITEYKDNWLVVMSLNHNLKEASYTNRCGVAYDFCVAAIGGETASTGGVYAANTNTLNGYTRKQGTSMAAPHVSGLVAVLMEKFPSLSNTQIVSRIKTTATYSGLTDKSGNSSESLSTSQKQSIWGQGFINSTAASSVIGSFSYPTGNNNSHRSRNISNSKISISSTISPKMFEKIKRSKFIVFDTFDGARFEVTGDVIFKKSNKKSTNIFVGIPNQIYQKQIEKISFFKVNQNDFFKLNSLSKGDIKYISNSTNFWNEKAGLFRGADNRSEQNVNQLEWNLNKIGPLNFNTSAIISDKHELISHGLSLKFQNRNQTFKSFIGVSNDNPSYNLGLINDKSIATKGRGIEFGSELMITDNISLFGGFNSKYLSNIKSSISNYGVIDGEEEGYTFGIHFNKNNENYVFGFSRQNELTNGTLEILSPAGKDSNGNIYWSKKHFNIEKENYMPFIASYSKKVFDNFSISSSLQEDENENGKLGSLRFFGKLKF